MTTITLYSTSACELCERAARLLGSMPELTGVTVRVVDIVSDDRLYRRLATRIPVLEVDGIELDWPFNADDVIAAL